MTQTESMGEVDDIADDPTPDGKHTYTKGLAKAGISRDSVDYKDSVEKALMWVRGRRSYYGFLIEEMRRTVTFEVSTMAVGITGSNVHLYINPDFAALMSTRHCAGVLQHECGHIYLGHIPRWMRMSKSLSRAEKRLAGAAMDLAVNSLLADPRDLPSYGLFPWNYRIPVPGKPEHSWPQFPTRATFEHYWELLQKLGEKEFGRQSGAAAGAGTAAPISDAEEEARAAGGGNGLGSGGTIDDHDMWDDVDSAMSAEIISEILREKIAKAEHQARSRGIGAGNFADTISELLSQKNVNFSALFQGLIGRFLTNIRRPTMMRPSRRYPSPPGRTMGRKLSIRYYQDTSGSMGNDDIQVGLSEAAHAEGTGLATVMVQQFDYGLQGEAIPIQRMGKVNVAVMGRGGTSLAPVIDDINKQSPDLAIISTDGGLEHNLMPKNGVHVVWILTHDGHAPPWGTVIRLPPPKESRR